MPSIKHPRNKTRNGFAKVKPEIPVVIMKLHHGGLGIARSLGRLGVPVYAIHPNAKDPTMASRYCREKLVWDIEQHPEEESLRFLHKLGQRIGPAILVATSDATTEFVSRNAGELSEHFMFPYLPFDLVKSLTCKRQMFHLARQHQIPTPDALFPQTREEVVEASRQITYPVMFKGIDGTRLKMSGRPKMMRVDSPQELLDAYDRWEDPADPNYMLQEFIPGGEDSVWMFNGFFDADSECRFGITGKKIRQYPAYKGATSLGICLSNPEVYQTTCRFMKAIGYRGILDIGYRYDARDGQYKVLDINPRIGSSFRLFVGTGGMDVIRVMYLSLTRQPIPQSTIIEGRKWLVENQDLASSVIYRRDGKLGLWEYLSSFKGVREATWLALDDPMPFFKMCRGYLNKTLEKAPEDSPAAAKLAEPQPIPKPARKDRLESLPG